MAKKRRSVVALRSAVRRLRMARPRPKWSAVRWAGARWDKRRPSKLNAAATALLHPKGRFGRKRGPALPVSHYEEPEVLVSADGRFEIRLTRDPVDIAGAQALRYRVFFEEMGARPNPEMARLRRDFDDFDNICDHLLVSDMAREPGDQVVGTYRLLRGDVARASGGFYTADEYDIAPFLERLGPDARVCEIGRSCVHADYRNNATIQLLWRGLARYYVEHRSTHVMGCASLPGTDVGALALPLSFLYHQHLAPPEIRVRALPGRFERMDLMAPGDVNARQALRVMPPLIKGYLRMGGVVGDGAVIDRQFHTTDVFVVLPMASLPEKYHAHFEREAALKT